MNIEVLGTLSTQLDTPDEVMRLGIKAITDEAFRRYGPSCDEAAQEGHWWTFKRGEITVRMRADYLYLRHRGSEWWATVQLFRGTGIFSPKVEWTCDENVEVFIARIHGTISTMISALSEIGFEDVGRPKVRPKVKAAIDAVREAGRKS